MTNTTIPGIELIAAASWIRVTEKQLETQSKELCNISQHWQHFAGCAYSCWPKGDGVVDDWGNFRDPNAGYWDSPIWEYGITTMDDYGNLVPMYLHSYQLEDSQHDPEITSFLGGEMMAYLDDGRLNWMLDMCDVDQRPFVVVDEWLNLWNIEPIPEVGVNTRDWDFSKTLFKRGPFSKTPENDCVVEQWALIESNLRFTSVNL